MKFEAEFVLKLKLITIAKKFFLRLNMFRFWHEKNYIMPNLEQFVIAYLFGRQNCFVDVLGTISTEFGTSYLFDPHPKYMPQNTVTRSHRL